MDSPTESNGRATIREVYDISQRIEEKIDKVSERTAVLEAIINSHINSPGHQSTVEQVDRLRLTLMRYAGVLTGIGIAVSVVIKLIK